MRLQADDGQAVRRLRHGRPPASFAGRAPSLLIAAVLGGLVTGLLAEGAALPKPQSVAAAQLALGVDMREDFAGEANPRQDVALMEAAARVQDVRAARAAREAREAEAANRRTLPLQGRLTTAFAMRWGQMHWGVDIAAPMLTPEYAAAAGIVLRAGPASGYGNVIYIQHYNGDVTVYGHMEEVLVQEGQEVDSGQLIARVGSRGFSTGPHLHFEVWAGGLNGQRVDPLAWLAEQGITL